jgi:signal transduction histidine kinase
LRFDDSLETVLRADVSTPFGMQTVWRQLVDLIGRGRVQADSAAIGRLAAMRGDVPPPVRAASARALAYAEPPAALVAFFADDAFNIAAPVLRTAKLPSADWLSLLPGLNPTTRSILRHRRDLPREVVLALDSFGAVDLVLEGGPRTACPAADEATIVPLPAPEPLPFIASPASTAARGTYPIAELVARIDAFQRQREDKDAPTASTSPIDIFRFDTDADGVVRHVEGIAREALVGLSLALGAGQGAAQLDRTAPGAFRRRSAFTGARLVLAGGVAERGTWLLSAQPAFDQQTGRFQGYHGLGRRLPSMAAAPPATNDGVRQLVHEVRTPANAIGGFAEMIDEGLLGPVPAAYRAHASAIRQQAAALTAAVDDLDAAARIDGEGLSLRRKRLPLGLMVQEAISELGDARVKADASVAGLVASADERAVGQLLDRLLRALLATAAPDELIAIDGSQTAGKVNLRFSRPPALPTVPAGPLLAAARDAREGEPPLGTGFALALARRLAEALGGALEIGPQSLTLRLPAGEIATMEQTAVLA